jgi:LmbE family N-acetylglucosaminyl deacetylase
VDVPSAYNVLSPHLDDAALSCSLLLAANPGCTVTTIFTAGPAAVRPLPPWDRAARYFREGADVMGLRRQEDQRAAGMVGAAAIHLGYWDRQYRTGQYGYAGPGEGNLLAAIAADLAGPAAAAAAGPWVIPLGLGHPDHRLASDAGLELARRLPGSVLVYADLPYAVEDGAEVSRRIADLRTRGFGLAPADTVRIAADRRLKRAAIACHESQRRSLRRRARRAVRAPERVWALVPC